MDFEWLNFRVITVLNDTFHCLNDWQFRAVRPICGKETPTPTYRLVDASNNSVYHFFTEAQKKGVHAIWPVPEQFVRLRMPSKKAGAIAVIDPEAAFNRFVRGQHSVTSRITWILPGAVLGEVENTLDSTPRSKRRQLMNSGEIIQSPLELTLQTAQLFTKCTHAASFVVGSRQALKTYCYDIDDVPLAEKPKRQLPKQYFEQRLSSGRPATRMP